MKHLSRICTALSFILLYAPLLVMIFFSFNSGKSTANFAGFSFDWYGELLRGGRMLEALGNSLILAVTAAVLATLLGLLAALGIFRMKNKFAKSLLNSVTNIPMMNPDIVTGISMLLFFVFVGAAIGYSPYRNFGTVLIAHVTFCLPYVILSITPKLHQMDKNLTEAALDLGCTPFKAFYKIELPFILPGILSGAIMAFTLSLDDFVISNFTCGQGFQTLPVYIYNMIKKRVTPDVYALYTILFFLILALLFLSNFIENKAAEDSDRHSKKNRAIILAGAETAENAKITSHNGRFPLSVRIVSVFTAFMIVSLSVLAIFVRANDPYADVEYVETEYAGQTIYVYNWGEYIADGSDETDDLIAIFEHKYGINVIYDTYDSNETLYSNLKSNAGTYDVVIPSDYMIDRLIKENLLQKINLENIPNYEYIADRYRGLYYDPTESYSVPYNVGMVGIVYNTTMVDEEDVGDWDLMWNAKYAGNILNFDNSRDGFATAQCFLGIDLNTEDFAELDRAYNKLVEQKAVLQGYVMDRVFAAMEGGSAAVAAYYAGDCLSMMEENEDLAFFYPESGTNIFVDAMCIPACATNVGAAELFINFMLEPEIAVENALYLYYASPNTAVMESDDYLDELGEDWYDILYDLPECYLGEGDELAETVQYYRHLPDDVLTYMNDLWARLKQK